jgi:murein tripeptide amidase MpaA
VHNNGKRINTSFLPALIAVTFAAGSLLGACSQGNSLINRDGAPDWNRYYSNDETNVIMQHYARKYPELTKLYSIGKSYKGVDLMLMEVTNFGNRPAEEKPGFYVDGNIHSGELTGSAVTLYLMGYLLDRYGEDPEVTLLLDTRVFYLRPKFNPDGADLVLYTLLTMTMTEKPMKIRPRTSTETASSPRCVSPIPRDR